MAFIILIMTTDIKLTAQHYNKESSRYSSKRYEGKTTNYIQFLFRKRLSIFLSFFNDVLAGFPDKKYSLVEIGCADGIIIQKLLNAFPNRFEKIVGLDISKGMIDEAKKNINQENVSFFVRGEWGHEQSDFVVRLGVHTSDVEEELQHIKTLLKNSGLLFYTFASVRSLHAKIKRKDDGVSSEYKTYKEYETYFKKSGFDVLNAKVYGFFVPKLWTFPKIARVLQPVIDKVMAPFFPELFHEKIYLLKKIS